NPVHRLYPPRKRVSEIGTGCVACHRSFIWSGTSIGLRAALVFAPGAPLRLALVIGCDQYFRMKGAVKGLALGARIATGFPLLPQVCAVRSEPCARLAVTNL